MDNSKMQMNDLSKASTQDIKESATDLLNNGKKLANDIYQEGKDRVNESVKEVEECVQEYSDNLIKTVRTNPLSAVLVSIGVGFLLFWFASLCSQ